MPTPLALFRFQVVSAFLAADPPRGQRDALRRTLAARIWTLPSGREKQFSAETLRKWIRRYQEGGLDALEDNRGPRGVRCLTDEQIEILCRLKRDVPERSVDRVLRIAEETGLLPPGTVSRSTVHRALQQHGLSRRPVARPKDLDRFEANFPGELWQSDLMAGPWLPNPDKPGKMRRAWLHAWLDDHSRLLVYGRFAFKQDLPNLELSFRQALRRCGCPRKVYYDNGAIYRSRHMAQICGELGIHKIVFTTPRRPEGHGKIEAFNRLCRAAFVSEVKASAIQTLDELNRAFAAWAEQEYNRRPHSELGTTPRARWQAGLKHLRPVDEGKLRRAFQWSETRTSDKAGVVSLFGRRYQVGAGLARRKVELRFDIENLEEVELWLEGRFLERVGLLQIGRHRRAKAETDTSVDEPSSEPIVDWLGCLADRAEGTWEDPEAPLRRYLAEQEAANEAVCDLFERHLSPEVYDRAAVETWLERCGPFGARAAEEAFEPIVEHMGSRRHIGQYIDALHTALTGEAS